MGVLKARVISEGVKCSPSRGGVVCGIRDEVEEKVLFYFDGL